MVETVMRPTSLDVEDFLRAVVNAERRADACTLLQLMTELTGQPAVMWGPSILGFGSYHYRYASGREGDAPLAAFSPRRAHLVIYLVGGFADRYASMVSQLGPHTSGVGCLYVKRLADIDLDVLRTLVDLSVREARGMDRESPTPPAASPRSPATPSD